MPASRQRIRSSAKALAVMAMIRTAPASPSAWRIRRVALQTSRPGQISCSPARPAAGPDSGGDGGLDLAATGLRSARETGQTRICADTSAAVMAYGTHAGKNFLGCSPPNNRRPHAYRIQAHQTAGLSCLDAYRSDVSVFLNHAFMNELLNLRETKFFNFRMRALVFGNSPRGVFSGRDQVTGSGAF